MADRIASAFSQRDLRWGAHKLGDTQLTLAEAGCLVSALASCLVDFGIDTDPGRLNSWLRERQGFLEGGRLVFGALEAYGVRVAAWVDCYKTPANLARLGRGLAGGWQVVALVDAAPGGALQAHWVRLLEVVENDCRIMDPWQLPGCEVGSLRQWYGGRGWHGGRPIFVYAAYARTRSARELEVAPQPAQLEPCLRPTRSRDWL